MIFPGKRVYIFTSSCCKCVVSGKDSAGCPVLSLLSFKFCWNPPTLLQTASFPSTTFPNIRHFQHRLREKKNESVPHISRIFSFIAQISFSSRKCNSHVCPFPHQLARGPVCSICSANPPTSMTCLRSTNFFLGDYLFSALI